jgi:hypothetical protein
MASVFMRPKNPSHAELSGGAALSAHGADDAALGADANPSERMVVAARSELSRYRLN